MILVTAAKRLDQSVKPFDDFFAMLDLTDLHKGEFLL
jgi:hypothetical protein